MFSFAAEMKCIQPFLVVSMLHLVVLGSKVLQRTVSGGARYVMGGTVGPQDNGGFDSRCAEELYITSSAACKEAAETLGITLQDCQNGQQGCVDHTAGVTKAEWTPASGASSEVNQDWIPAGCNLVPGSTTSTSQRRRQLRWNSNSVSRKRNPYASPICYVQGSLESRLEGAGSVCRLSEQDGTTHGNGSTCRSCPKVASMEACEQSCVSTAGCTGYEFRSTDGRCEVWTQPIGYKKPAHSKWSCIKIRG